MKNSQRCIHVGGDISEPPSCTTSTVVASKESKKKKDLSKKKRVFKTRINKKDSEYDLIPNSCLLTLG